MKTAWLGIALALCACGGPEDAFVGRYRAVGTLTWTLNGADGVREEQYPAPNEVTVDPVAGRWIEVGFGTCAVPLEVESADVGAFLGSPVVCEWAADAGARYEFLSASLRRAGEELEFRAAGNLRGEERGIFGCQFRLVGR